MPLRDHFHPPEIDEIDWESVHSAWLNKMVEQLNDRVLPRSYRAVPHVHFGPQVQPDLANFEQDDPILGVSSEGGGNGVATAVWAPPQALVEAEIDFRGLDLFEVRVYDARRGRHLVAVIELLSPANKNRPAHREAFATKCASFLQQGVSVLFVDVVTDRLSSPHNDLMRLLRLEQRVPLLAEGALASVAYRTTKTNETWKLGVWPAQLPLGGVLPTVPVWLADDLPVPLDLEVSYGAARRSLRLS